MAVDWRSLAVGIVFLVDLVVFAELARDEWRESRAARRQARTHPAQTKVARTSIELSQPMRSKVSAIQRSAVS